ncbi:MAG: hypothetical protein ACI8UD_001532 [Planctomycetota bacterium]|jgi:hypothetical protein
MTRTTLLSIASKLLCGLTLLSLASCDIFDSDDSVTGDQTSFPPTSAQIAAALNQAIILPPGSFTLNNPQIDPSATVTTTSGGMSTLRAGATISPSIGFTSNGSANVTGAGIAFGFGGQQPTSIMVVPINTNGASGGNLDFTFSVPQSFCENLSQICHDVQCYEFAVVDGQRITAANVQAIAVACGQCDEPSCQSLLTDCPTTSPQCPNGCPAGKVCVEGVCVQSGLLRFTLIWNAPIDIDLHVVTPGGTEVYFANPSGDGCALDVDNTSGGAGSVENIVCTDPASGTFQMFAVNFTGSGSDNIQLEAVLPNGQAIFQQSTTINSSQSQTFQINT